MKGSSKGKPSTPKINQSNPKLGGGNVKGSNEDRAKPKQGTEYAGGKKTNP